MPEKMEKMVAQVAADEAVGNAVEKRLFRLLEGGFKRVFVSLISSLTILSVLAILALNFT